ncbi:MAG: septum formation protein Maf [Planctomycetaceae bacterium]|nr:septum formation protein Maf [Planctomycetaceae bacterium]
MQASLPRIILASTSRYRRQLVKRLGVPFDCVAPLVDEELLKDPRLAPLELARHLARAKARSVAELHPDAIVIGSDQLAVIDEQVLGKPGSRARAIEQLTQLAGRAHRLITAMSVWHRGVEHDHVDVTTLTMRDLTPVELARYVDADEPFDCAGSYKLEARGIALFASIETADHTAITGLPLIALVSMLRDFGVSVP